MRNASFSLEWCRMLVSTPELIGCVKDADVFYCSTSTTVIIHWTIGDLFFIRQGAASVRVLSDPEEKPSNSKKSVFLCLGSALSPPLVDSIQEQVMRGSYANVSLVLSFDEDSQNIVFGLSVSNVIDSLHQKLKITIPNLNILVHYIPISIIPVTDNILMVPGGSGIFPLLPHQLPSVHKYLQSCNTPSHVFPKQISDVSLRMFSPTLQSKILCFAEAIAQLCSVKSGTDEDSVPMFGGNPSVFALGCMSKMVAREIVRSPIFPTKSRSDDQRLSIILVDRTCDLFSALSHSEQMLDQIINVYCEYQCGYDISCVPNSLLPDTLTKEVKVGSLLAHPADADLRKLVHILIHSKKAKDCLTFLRTCLLGKIQLEDLTIPTKSATMSPELLRSYVTLLTGNPVVPARALRHRALLNICHAVLAVFEKHGDGVVSWKSLSDTEKIFQMTAEDDSPSLLNNLCDVFKTSNRESDNMMNVADVLQLAVLCFEMTGEFSEDDVVLFKGILIQGLLSRPCAPWVVEILGADVAKDLTGYWQQQLNDDDGYDSRRLRMELEDSVDNVIIALQSIGSLRNKSPPLAPISTSLRPRMIGGTSHSLISRLVTAILPVFVPDSKKSTTSSDGWDDFEFDVDDKTNSSIVGSGTIKYSTASSLGLEQVKAESFALGGVLSGFVSSLAGTRHQTSTSEFPGHASVILLVIVGGLTSNEARDAAAAVDAIKIPGQNAPPRVILISSDWVTHSDLIRRLFSNKLPFL